MSTARPSKVYVWVPTWQSGHVLGWLLIAVAGLSILEAPFDLGRALSATAVTVSGFGSRWSYASPIAFVVGPVAFACEILWLIWQHRVTADLWARGVPGLRFSPGWAVGWWFVPFAWWVQPFRAVRELSRHAGRTEPNGIPAVSDGVLAGWWATYLASQFVAVPAVVVAIRAFAPAFSHLGEGGVQTITIRASDLRAIAAWALVGSVFRIAAALLAARVVWTISRAEDAAPALAVPQRPDL